jgi:hypothetical protein
MKMLVESERSPPKTGTPLSPQLSLLAANPYLTSLRKDLVRKAYCKITGPELIRAIGPEVDLTEIQSAAAGAPRDSYDSLGTRFRSLGYGIYIPWNDDLRFVPPKIDPASGQSFVEYFQSPTINRDAGGLVRRFAPLPSSLKDDPTFHRVIRACLMATPRELVSRDDMIRVGVHVIRYEPSRNVASVGVPDSLHQDEEVITWILEIGRSSNLVGAQTSIAQREAAMLENADAADLGLMLMKYTPKAVFDGAACWDSRVTHAISPSWSNDGETAYRSVLLIDFANLYAQTA